MKPTVATVLIAGAGRIGSRYLQGLAKCRIPLRIYVQHFCETSLVRAEQRWNELLGPETHHEVSFHASFELLPRQLNIAIVATTADIRPRVIGEIASLADVQFWVLEKVLAQSESGLDNILSYISDASSAWVNTSRRLMPWHQLIKSQLNLHHPMTMKIEGGAWGMACNAIHFLDLFAWWSGETLQDICTDHLDAHWFNSKRQGHWEVCGSMMAQFSGGSHMLLISREDVSSTSMEVSDGRLLWLIKETEGLAIRSDRIEIPGNMLHQGEISAGLVETILESHCCGLATLEESVALHRVFISGMLEHWKRAGHHAAAFVPIT